MSKNCDMVGLTQYCKSYNITCTKIDDPICKNMYNQYGCTEEDAAKISCKMGCTRIDSSNAVCQNLGCAAPGSHCDPNLHPCCTGNCDNFTKKCSGGPPKPSPPKPSPPGPSPKPSPPGPPPPPYTLLIILGVLTLGGFISIMVFFKKKSNK